MLAMRRWLLLGGVTASVVYLGGIDVLTPAVYPERHDYASQMVSELLARATPTRALLFPLMLVYNALIFGLAAGVWLAADGRRSRYVTAVALLGYAVASTSGLLVAEMDVREAGITPRTALHIAATALQGAMMLLALVEGAFTLGWRFRWYTVATVVIALGAGTGAGIVAGAGVFGGIGLLERASIYAWMTWLAVLAVLLRAEAPDQVAR